MKKKGSTNIIVFTLLLLAFIVLLFKKDKLTCFVTNYMLRHNNVVVIPNDSIRFFSQFDYSTKQLPYKLTIVELSGNGCKPCLRMDTVLKKLSDKYNDKVKVVTYKLVDDTSRVIAKYFVVNMIPTQIILDRNGDEVFRHTGFLSEEELSEIINKNLKR